MKQFRPRLSESEYDTLMQNRKKDNILIIGDLHCPFDLDDYLEFCIETYKEYNCNRVVFIGDVIDNHYSSFHETDADGMGGGCELDFAISRLSRYRDAFPVADVIIGNHDRIIMRKAQSSAIPSKWIKSFKEVLEVPDWNFTERLVIKDTQLVHGEAGKASTKCRGDMMNTIQGHLHTQMGTEWFVGINYRVFGSQVGCGIDWESYAMAYAKAGKKPAIGLLVLKEERIPINIPMPL